MSHWSEITGKIQTGLPRWWKMRRDKKSLGAQFLNVFGLTLEDVQFALHYALDQRYLGRADLGQVDIVYKATLPNSLTPSMKLQLLGQNYRLQATEDLNTFLTGMPEDTLSYQEVYYENPYFIDWAKSILYVRRPYEVTPDYPEGSLSLTATDDMGRPIFSRTLSLHIHHVWNFFDEFGLLLNTPRLYGEKNDNYKRRLLDVFRYPANASHQGLLNGIARELNLTREETWPDDRFDYVLYPPRVNLVSIRVDEEKVDPSRVEVDASGRAILLGDVNASGQSHQITYAAGVDTHALHDKSDTAFQDLLYTPEGTATPLLTYYVDQINKQVPVMWGQFVFGEGFWDIATPDLSGTGFLPVVLDANFSKWTSYSPKG